MSPEAERRRKVRRQILDGHIKQRWFDLFRRKVRLEDGLAGCATWTGCRTGYSDRHDGRPTWYGLSAAKVAWIMRNREPWPEGHHAAHLCRNRDCVSPLHVLPMTPSEHYEYDKDHENHEWSNDETSHQNGADVWGSPSDDLPVPY